MNRDEEDDAGAHSVTVVIVAYQAGSFLQPCVDALAAQTFRNFEAVIVDNASTDCAVDQLTLPDARFRVDRPGANLGFAAANNRIARECRSRWLATLNPDTRAAPDWLERLLAGARRWPDAAAFGSTQLRLGEPETLDGAGDVWHAAGIAWRALEGQPATENPPEGETFAPCAAAALYERETFLRLGGFDESFFCYCEDIDLGFRLNLVGGRSIQIPDAIVHHEGSGTTGLYSDFTVFYGHRNRIWTFVKNTPGLLMWVLLPLHIALNWRILQSAPDERYQQSLQRAYAAAWKGRKAILAARVAVQKERRASLVEVIRAMAWRPKLITRRAALLDKSGERIKRCPR